MDGWLVIPGWAKWQSRRDRRDPWLKDWLDQLDRDEYLTLTLAERGLIVDIRRAYARFDGQLRAAMLPGYIHARVRQKQLDRLVDAGLLTISAAKPPPLGGEAAARAREEEEEEKETPYPFSLNGEERTHTTARERGENPRAVAARGGAERRARAWIDNGLARMVPDEHLEEVIADEFALHDPELVADLATYARQRIK